ncbi:MAG: trypsin-like peptidase domain-containing protein [Halobacteriovoraceae bacterium]|jgi:V8-like Glu-specific endopeptidase|nr:trypsin-like peptidase domain-containing protein [Halobacteriovoraceae bacterium]
MEKKLASLLTLLLTFSTFGYAKTKIIYGTDDRVESTNYSDPLFQKLALSTAGQFWYWDLEPYDEDYYQLPNKILMNELNVCSEERFSNQLALANCTAFLVAPDILVTAGHCIFDQEDCDERPWVFDYNQQSLGKKRLIPKTSVYYCSEILKRVDDKKTGADFAILKLHRKVFDRDPLKMRRSGKIKEGEKLVVIGSPSGLPTKISGGAQVFGNDLKHYFKANLDTFGGNSGSPVFNASTGNVEGILVRGEKDYVSPDNTCDVVNYCPDILGGEGCEGEESTRISEVIPYLPSR